MSRRGLLAIPTHVSSMILSIVRLWSHVMIKWQLIYEPFDSNLVVWNLLITILVGISYILNIHPASFRFQGYPNIAEADDRATVEGKFWTLSRLPQLQLLAGV